MGDPQSSPTRFGGIADGARGLDHIIVAVRDLEAAARRFARLGFFVSPKMIHPFGTANRLIMFQGNFIELLAIEDESRPGSLAALRDLLASTPGYAWGLLFRTEDAEAEHRRCAACGLEPSGLNRGVEREVVMPGGSARTARFSSFALRAGQESGYLEGFSQQHVPEAVWIPQWQVHDNCAVDILSVTVVAQDLRAFADRYVRLFGPECVHGSGSMLAIDTARGRIEVITPQLLDERFDGSIAIGFTPGPRIVAARLLVADCRTLQRQLGQAGVAFQTPANDSIRVPPEAACGLALEFVDVHEAPGFDEEARAATG